MQTDTQRRAAFRSAQASYDNASPPDNDAEFEALGEIESEEFNRLIADDGEIADSLGTFLKREQAKAFFAARGAKTHVACPDPKCCRRGWQSMV